jgi:hypothetical protein
MVEIDLSQKVGEMAGKPVNAELTLTQTYDQITEEK